jgi:hypothetical protein
MLAGMDGVDKGGLKEGLPAGGSEASGRRRRTLLIASALPPNMPTVAVGSEGKVSNVRGFNGVDWLQRRLYCQLKAAKQCERTRVVFLDHRQLAQPRSAGACRRRTVMTTHWARSRPKRRQRALGHPAPPPEHSADPSVTGENSLRYRLSMPFCLQKDRMKRQTQHGVRLSLSLIHTGRVQRVQRGKCTRPLCFVRRSWQGVGAQVAHRGITVWWSPRTRNAGTPF